MNWSMLFYMHSLPNPGQPVEKGKLACPLCRLRLNSEFYRDQNRSYYQCSNCHLISVDPEQFLSRQEERAEYDLHQNNPQDPDYRKFLSRMFVPMQQRLPPGSKGLDFGSGPGPTLSVMFEEVGHSVALYDPFYAPQDEALKETYDFITATETVEHLYNPREDLDTLWSCLKPNGWLGIMTQLASTLEHFKGWRYRTEATHVCFFSRPTFEWLASRWRAELTFVNRGVVLIQRSADLERK